MSLAPVTSKPSQRWLLVLALLLAALLHAATWVGIGQGAFVLWNSIHAFYFQQSYGAGLLPLAVALLLSLTMTLLLFKRLRWATVPAFGAMIVSLVTLPRMGHASLMSPFLHPMQLVHWAAMTLTWVGCIWLFMRNNSGTHS